MVNFTLKAVALTAILAAAAPQLNAQDAPPAMPQAPAEAQASDSTQSRAARMSAEIAAAISEYTKDMAALEKQIRDKDISKEDAERRRKELNDRLEERLEAIESMAEAWAETLEESIENLELNLGDNLKLNIEPLEPKKKKFKKKMDGLVLLVGSNTLLNAPTVDIASADPYVGDWKANNRSSTLGIYFTNQRRLGRTPLWAKTGWGFTGYTYDFGQKMLSVPPMNSGIELVAPANSVELRRSNLTMSYFEVPLSLVINPSRRGKGLNLSAGGFVGLRLGGTRQIVYRAEGMGRVTENTNGNFYGSLFSYGLQAELGYRRFSVGVRQNFNQPFVVPATWSSTPPQFYNASLFATVRL
ncbi:MAG: hypothetical protein RL157_990 [Bacteroidota bacterium]